MIRKWAYLPPGPRVRWTEGARRRWAVDRTAILRICNLPALLDGGGSLASRPRPPFFNPPFGYNGPGTSDYGPLYFTSVASRLYSVRGKTLICN